MRLYCKRCKQMTEALDGYYYKKCSKCYHPVRDDNSWIVTLAVLLGILTLILMFSGLAGAYSASANVSTTSTIGTIRGDFYGVNAGGYNWFGNGTQLLSSSLYSNVSYAQSKFSESNMGLIRMTSGLHNLYSNQTTRTDGINFTGNLYSQMAQVKYAYDNNKKVLVNIQYTPSWLMDNSTGLCTNPVFCPPSNYTIWNNIIVHYINNITNGGQYISAIAGFEIWNEPDTAFFMGKATSQYNNSIYYNILFNNTYNILKSAYPATPVYGPATDETMNAITFGWISNFSYFGSLNLSYHRYYKTTNEGTDFGALLLNNVDGLFSNCTVYGVTCNSIYLSEWGIFNSTKQNNTAYWNVQSRDLSSGYTSILNKYPDRVSMLYYQWSERVNYTSASFPGRPLLHSMLSEPQMDGTVYPSYNITKLFASNHKAGNTVLNSSSNDTQLKVVASKDPAGKYFITLTNTNASAVNVTLNVPLTNSYLRNVETNATYPVVNGVATIQNLAAYGVLTLDSNAVTATVDFLSLIGVVRGDFYGVNSREYPSSLTILNNSVYTNASNVTWHIDKLQSAKITVLRRSMFLTDTALSNGNWVTSGYSNINVVKDMVNYSYQYGGKVLLIADNTPTFLANLTSGYCTAASWYTCAPNDTDRWANITRNYIDYVTNNGQWNSSVEVQVMNEPEGTSFLNNLSASSGNATIRSVEYNKIYNATYTKIKQKYPNMAVGGYAGSYLMLTSVGLPIWYGFLGNFSNRTDFVSYNNYLDPEEPYFDTELQTDINIMIANCSTYSANCSRLLISEFNIYNSTILNTSSWNNWTAMQFSLAYSGILNYYPSRVDMMPYTWSWKRMFSDPSYGGDFPYDYRLVSEPYLDGVLKPSYNITKLFGKYAPASASIYNVTLSYSTVKAVVSKKNGACNIILTNTNSTAVEVAINASTSSCGNVWMREDNGTLLNASSGTITPGSLDGYAVKAFTTPNLTLTSAGLNKTNWLGEQIGTLGSEVNISSDATVGALRTVRIVSNLPSHTEKVILTVADCNKIQNVKYTPKNGTTITPSYTCNNNTITFDSLTINPSNDSNVITFDTVESSCNTIINQFGEFGTYFGIIGMAVVLVIVVGLLGVAGKVDTKFVVSAVLALVMSAALIIFGINVQNYLCQL